MPSPPMLEIDALLQPIPGDEPAGGSIPFAVKQELEDARKEIDPSLYAHDDPTRPTDAKKANWPRIVDLTTETLTATSKDLILAARLTEALTRLHGYAGLRDGLTLFRRLVEECWDRLRPPIEEPDDLEMRAAAFEWLDDEDRGARFPFTIRAIPLLKGSSGPISWQDWHLMQAGKGELKIEEFERAIALAPRELCQTTVEDLEAAAQELSGLLNGLTSQMGAGAAPGMSMVRRTIGEGLTLARLILGRKGPPPTELEASAEGEAGAVEGGATPSETAGNFAGRSAQSRAQIYQRLTEAADLLQKTEPHSPIPFMVRRAIELGHLTFPQLMKALISDSSVLQQMSQSLGIAELSPDYREPDQD